MLRRLVARLEGLPCQRCQYCMCSGHHFEDVGNALPLEGPSSRLNPEADGRPSGDTGITATTIPQSSKHDVAESLASNNNTRQGQRQKYTAPALNEHYSANSPDAGGTPMIRGPGHRRIESPGHTCSQLLRKELNQMALWEECP